MPRTGSSPPSSRSSRHEAFIRALREENHLLRTTGFKKALRERLEEHTGEAPDLDWFRVIPDAYEVSSGLVIAYEVEDTHRVDDAKLRAYARLWARLRDLEWTVRLVIVDIRGGRIEPDLPEVFYFG